MSNRVYLFSTNFVPGTDVDQRRMGGISEWGNELPLGFKILVSANPRQCPSLVFEDSESGAIVADYEPGVSRFLEFLARLPHPHVPDLAEEARVFLTAAHNRNGYFLLEPEEYFWLGNDKQTVQMDALLAELADLESAKVQAIEELRARMYEEDHPPGFFARLFGASTPIRRENTNDMVQTLALAGWSNELFYQPE